MNSATEKLLTDQLSSIMLKALQPGFHGRAGLFCDFKDGQIVSTETILTTKSLARKEYAHN